MVSIERHPPNGGIEKKKVVLASLWYQLAMVWVLFQQVQDTQRFLEELAESRKETDELAAADEDDEY
jgi:hypothetical protein